MLDNLYLSSRRNQHWIYSGVDTPEHCLDKTHFAQYPFAIDYQYNSRGFRDQEWPESLEELQSAIWCVGDSFTVGLGQPFAHIWPQVLSQKLNRRSINISMDGASNHWISRRARQILAEIQPKIMILMWSYVDRYEHPDSSLDDEERRRYSVTASINKAVLHLCQEIDYFSQVDCKVIQCVVPNGMGEVHSGTLDQLWNSVRGPDWPKSPPRTLQQYAQLSESVQHELRDFYKIDDDIKSLLGCEKYFNELVKRPEILGEISRLDLARDGHHFDVITSDFLVSKIKDLLL